jgi:hypothetical protein
MTMDLIGTGTGTRMKPSGYCFRIGGTAWILLLGLALLSFLGRHLVNYGIQPGAWPVLEISLGGGGVLCFMVGAILSLWER